ncbi:hypothetical protein HNQ02_001388 [Flavobacterium sp. 7E]|uniref:RICIN domain-containing protein n=1 Tax=Flavobacterium sp. 7E TaxID=2735898 RepID=UPI0015710F49|nr:RICIN domain-containing protein [Flavobacterium sp. 7E]NRS88474.1 hypothetical protein [Flavobacterium sp. 7E]
MVEAKIEPYYSSYNTMVADSKSSYNYVVQGKTSFTELGRDSGVNYGAWNSDIRAAYYNAIRWYITGDTRHANKAVEIFKAWSNLTSVTSNGTESLSGGVAYIMIEAAEIIKSTYTGWSATDVNKFKAMLVYPGYSSKTIPTNIKDNATFYWKVYQGDPVRHGNQGLSGWRTCMSLGIFLDNEIMYDRALLYIKGLPHRSDDLPYPSGPNTSTTISATGEHADTYNITSGNAIQDYGFNEVLTNYIYSNGQCQESSRDQAHVLFGMGLIASMAEMAWNQGEDLYSYQNNRFLQGLEFSLKYNVSYKASYPDQTTPWQPTTFNKGFDRTGRWYSKSISPDGIGDFTKNRPNWELTTAHYIGRGFKTENDAKWTLRARDKSIELDGYEKAGWTNDALGWGGLTFRRPSGCYGDPISGFASGLPVYNMNALPMTIEAENYDYSPVNGEGRTYHDVTSNNSGGKYRLTDGVDVQTCTEGGYNLAWLANGEWVTYTVNVPENGTYDIDIRYAAVNSNGKIKFAFNGVDKTEEITVPTTSGWQNWNDFKVKSGITLTKGVQSMKIFISGVSSSYNLNNITISANTILKTTSKLVQIKKRNASNFAIDGNSGGADGQNVYLWLSDASNVNQQWIEIDHGNGYYSYQKENTNFCIDGNGGGVNGQNVYLWTYKEDNQNQQWKKVAMDSGYFRLEKRNAPGFSLDGGSGGANGQNISLYDSSSTSQNLQWSITEITTTTAAKTTAAKISSSEQNTFSIYPNPVEDVLTFNLNNNEINTKSTGIIFDTSGTVTKSFEFDASNPTISVKELKPGVYLLNIEGKKGVYATKFIKK